MAYVFVSLSCDGRRSSAEIGLRSQRWGLLCVGGGRGGRGRAASSEVALFVMLMMDELEDIGGRIPCGEGERER
jgi:hypothetical protein